MKGLRILTTALIIGSAFIFINNLHTHANQNECAKPAPALQTKEVCDFVQVFANKVLKSLPYEERALPYDKRIEVFKQLLHEGFDTHAIARYTLGRWWNVATEAEQKEYLDLFDSMLIDVYATYFKDYNVEKINIIGSRQDSDGGLTIQTQVFQKDKPSIFLDWKVFKVQNQPKILNVIVEGLNVSLNQQKLFTSYITSHGGSVRVLLDAIKNKTLYSQNSSPKPESANQSPQK